MLSLKNTIKNYKPDSKSPQSASGPQGLVFGRFTPALFHVGLFGRAPSGLYLGGPPAEFWNAGGGVWELRTEFGLNVPVFDSLLIYFSCIYSRVFYGWKGSSV